MLLLYILIMILVCYLFFQLYKTKKEKKQLKKEILNLKKKINNSITLVDAHNPLPFLAIVLKNNQLHYLSPSLETFKIDSLKKWLQALYKSFNLPSYWVRKIESCINRKIEYKEMIHDSILYIYHNKNYCYLLILPAIINKKLQQERNFFKKRLTEVMNGNNIYINKKNNYIKQKNQSNSTIYSNDGKFLIEPKYINVIKAIDNILGDFLNLMKKKVIEEKIFYYIDLLQIVIKGQILSTYRHEEQKNLCHLDLQRLLEDKVANNNLRKNINIIKNQKNYGPIYMPIAHLYYLIDNIIAILQVCVNIDEITWEEGRHYHRLVLYKIHSYYLNRLENLLTHKLFKITLLALDKEYYCLTFYLPTKKFIK